MTSSNRRKPGLRVGRMPDVTTSPITVTRSPARIRPIATTFARSSYRRGSRSSRSSTVKSPTRWNSDARLGPTPLTNWSGVDRKSSATRGLLDDCGTTVCRFDRSDAGRQLEGLTELKAPRLFRRARVEADDCLQRADGNRNAVEHGRFDREHPLPVARVPQDAGARQFDLPTHPRQR